MSRKTTKHYWEEKYQATKLRPAKKNDCIRMLIERHIPVVEHTGSKDCIEIGCFPGTYLAIFGDLGYRLNGVDYCKQLAELHGTLEHHGYIIGNFVQEDFLEFKSDRQYDVVASFGFIEHFSNFSELIEKHIDMLAPGGYLVILTPNFIGKFQHWIHQKTDKENFDRHYIPAMDVATWKHLSESRGLETVYAGYFGRFNIIDEKDNKPAAVRAGLKAIKKLKWFFNLFIPSGTKSFSPYAGLIARKASTAEQGP